MDGSTRVSKAFRGFAGRKGGCASRSEFFGREERLAAASSRPGETRWCGEGASCFARLRNRRRAKRKGLGNAEARSLTLMFPGQACAPPLPEPPHPRNTQTQPMTNLLFRLHRPEESRAGKE